VPRVNGWYWEPKLARNVERDRAAGAALTSAGWIVFRVWEHEDLTDAAARIASVLLAEDDGASILTWIKPSCQTSLGDKTLT
jgi:DNA mismatch endonuclease (patch repair protein)